MPVLRHNEIDQVSRRRLEQLRERTVREAARASRARRQAQQARSEREELEANPPDVATRPAGERALALFFPLLLAGAAFGEWVISVPAAEWLTLAVLGRPEWLPWTRLALPLGIIAADVIAAYLRVQSQEDEFAGKPDFRRAVGWLLLAAMTALSLATQLARWPSAGAAPHLTQTYWVRTAGVVGITVVLHALLMLSGRTLMESLSYWGFMLQRHRLAREEASQAEVSEESSRAALSWFERYVRARHLHVQRFGDPGPEAIDVTTREELRRQLGYDPFGAPAGAPAPPAPAPEAPPNGGGSVPAWEEETEVRV